MNKDFLKEIKGTYQLHSSFKKNERLEEKWTFGGNWENQNRLYYYYHC